MKPYKYGCSTGETLTFGSLFAGIGGFDLGLERAGMACKWQVEINDYCNKVLAKHWPDVRRYKDVKECGKHNLEPVDVICGGFPCQPHSVAGKRRGAADDRNLWPEFLRVVREVRPTWVVAENVPGIVSLYLDTVLSDLEGESYTCWTFNIPACAFDAPHRRERIFVLAHTTRERWGRGRDEDVQGQSGTLQTERPRSGKEQGFLANVEGIGQRRVGQTANEWSHDREVDTPYNTSEIIRKQSWWTVEPDVGRVAHGVPARVERLRALGNAVVPQVAEWIGRKIVEIELNETI